MDIPKLVESATLRAHRTVCAKELTDCGGPTEVEMMLTAIIVESTIPAIMEAISLEFRQALHSMAAGFGAKGEPDATGEDPEELIADWFRWWRDSDGPAKLPDALHVRTAAYLTVRAVQSGNAIRGPKDL